MKARHATPAAAAGEGEGTVPGAGAGAGGSGGVGSCGGGCGGGGVAGATLIAATAERMIIWKKLLKSNPEAISWPATVIQRGAMREATCQLHWQTQKTTPKPEAWPFCAYMNHHFR